MKTAARNEEIAIVPGLANGEGTSGLIQIINDTLSQNDTWHFTCNGLVFDGGISLDTIRSGENAEGSTIGTAALPTELYKELDDKGPRWVISHCVGAIAASRYVLENDDARLIAITPPLNSPLEVRNTPSRQHLTWRGDDGVLQKSVSVLPEIAEDTGLDQKAISGVRRYSARIGDDYYRELEDCSDTFKGNFDTLYETGRLAVVCAQQDWNETARSYKPRNKRAPILSIDGHHSLNRTFGADDDQLSGQKRNVKRVVDLLDTF